jgi:GTP-binding protein
VKFVDEAVITVQSGHGGRGCVSFRREKFIPKGGPDGGDGGKGGDVVLRADSQRRTLYQFRFKRQFSAPNGQPGQGSRKTGRGGKDLFIDVPPGTIVSDADTGEVVKDFFEPGDTFVLAKGGRGGRGNSRFKSATHRTPRFAQPGEPGEEYRLKLELKLLADVGIIGLPNAGKSTLISKISSAHPKIGDYPFTTLTPELGVVHTDWADPFVVADIPGLIEGAHSGAGLGIQFLRHIERTRVLIHLIDAAGIKPDAPLIDYETVLNELVSYNPKLGEKPQLLVLSKMDLSGADEGAEAFQNRFDELEILRVSSHTGDGLQQLKSKLVQILEK